MLYRKPIYYLIFLFLLTNIFSSVAYHSELSLEEKERNAKINEYLSIAQNNVRKDNQLARDAAQKARNLSQGFAIDKSIESNIIMIRIYQQNGNIDSAKLMLDQTLIEAESIKNDSLIAEIYHHLGINYQFGGSPDLAIESYHKAIEINESLGLKEASLKQNNNIGLIYSDEKEYDTALKYMEKCLSISREIGHKKFESFSYVNIGYILMKQKKWEAALERFEKTLELGFQKGDTIYFCTIHYLIADVKLNQKDYLAAKVHAKKALNAARHSDYAIGTVFSQRVLSDVFLHEKKYAQARDLIAKTIDYLKKNHANLYLEDVLNTSYNIEYETGNYKKALAVQQQLSARKDSLNQIKSKEKISNSEYKYQLLKNEQENQLLKIKNESSEKTSIYALAIAFLLLLLVFLSLFAYSNSKNINKTLEQAIEERTKELADSNKELAESNENLAKSNEELERFAFIASHDLKTPLRDIVSFTGLLERRLKSNNDKHIHEYLSFIKKGGMRLNNLITDTLEYSRISSQQQGNKLQIIDLNMLFSELENVLSNHIKEKNARILKSNNLPSIKANHSAIILLFQNLIENSIKYNKSKTPTIKISTQENDDSVSILVEDNGIGIPAEYNEDIFVMFSRLHNKDEYEGSGLGLSICKKIVNQLNGEILIESELDQGSIFEIKFPMDIVIKNTYKLNSGEAN